MAGSGSIEMVAAQAATGEAIARALDGEFALVPVESVEGDAVLLDTFDRLVRSEGWQLSHERGRLTLRDRSSSETVNDAEFEPAPTAPVFARDLPDGSLREALADVIEVRALLPLARVRIRSEAYRVLDSLQKTVVRVNVLVPSVVPPRGPTTPLSTRVRLEGVRGYEDERDDVARALTPVLSLGEPDRSLADEAIVAVGEPVEGVSTKVEVRMKASEDGGVAVARVLRRLLGVIDANLPGVIADIDSEFLHDYRVSIRRTRAVQREFKHVFPPDPLDRLRTEFKWLQQATGDSRDLDVYVLGFDEMRDLVEEPLRGDLDPLLRVLKRRRTLAHGAMVRDLRSERARALREDWEALLGVIEDPSDADRRNSRAAIGELASKRIRKVYKRMVKMGEAIGSDSPPEDYHELRKKGKELRYLLELFGAPLHDADVVKPMIKTLKSLQDVLGHHQDREVQMTMLRSLADDVSALPGGPQALLAMGVLIERLEADAAETRRRFAEVFADFAAKDQRRLVKDTFA